MLRDNLDSKFDFIVIFKPMLLMQRLLRIRRKHGKKKALTNKIIL
jgi:hypothetical protein